MWVDRTHTSYFFLFFFFHIQSEDSRNMVLWLISRFDYNGACNDAWNKAYTILPPRTEHRTHILASVLRGSSDVWARNMRITNDNGDERRQQWHQINSSDSSSSIDFVFLLPALFQPRQLNNERYSERATDAAAAPENNYNHFATLLFAYCIQCTSFNDTMWSIVYSVQAKRRQRKMWREKLHNRRVLWRGAWSAHNFVSVSSVGKRDREWHRTLCAVYMRASARDTTNFNSKLLFTGFKRVTNETFFVCSYARERFASIAQREINFTIYKRRVVFGVMNELYKMKKRLPLPLLSCQNPKY